MSTNINEKTKELQQLVRSKSNDINKLEELIQQGANVNAPLAEGELQGTSILNLCFDNKVRKPTRGAKYSTKRMALIMPDVFALLIDKGAKPDEEAIARITKVLEKAESNECSIIMNSLDNKNLLSPEIKFKCLNSFIDTELDKVRMGYAHTFLNLLLQYRSDLLQSKELFESFKAQLATNFNHILQDTTPNNNSAVQFKYYIDFIELFKPEKKKYEEIIAILQSKIEDLKALQPGHDSDRSLKDHYIALDEYIKHALSSSTPTAPIPPFPSARSAASAAKPSSQSEHDKGDKKASVDAETTDEVAKPRRQ